MKNTRDTFDDELRNRLDNYSEEPDDKLWSGIASNIVTVKPPFAWVKWLSISSAVVITTATIVYFSLNGALDKNLTQAASASLVEEAVNAGKSIDTLAQVENTSVNGQAAGDEEQSATAIGEAHTSDNRAIEEGSERSTTSTQPLQSSSTQNAQQGTVNVASQATGSRSTVTTDSDGETSTATIAPTSNVIDRRESRRGTSQSTATTDANRSEPMRVTSTLGSVDTNEQRSKIATTTSPTTSENSVALGEKENNAASSSQALADPSILTMPKEEHQSKVQGTSVNEKQDDARHISRATSEDVVKDSTNNKAEDKPLTKAVASKEDGEDKKQKSNRKLSLYFTAMPTLGYQRIEANQNDNVFVESISKVSNFSTKRLGVRAEIGAEYALTRKFRVFGGVLYYQRKQTINYVERVPVNDIVENPVDTVVVIQPEFTSQERTFEYELRNLGVQLGVNYILKEKKFLHTIGTGIEFHKALNKLPADQQELGFHSNPSTFVFANVYYRLQYPAQGRLRGVFQPTFNYSLYLNQDMNAPFFVKPYGLGLNVGLTYHF
jgi:hypothetical protein